MGSLATQDSAVADFLEILEEHRKNCERLGKYVEAEIARKRMDELRGHEEARRREALRARQLAEVLSVEEAHMMEFQQFNAMWDAKMAAYEQSAEQLMQAMRVRRPARRGNRLTRDAARRGAGLCCARCPGGSASCAPVG